MTTADDPRAIRRKDLVDQAAYQLQATRFLVLTGEAGAGKSRVAAELAGRGDSPSPDRRYSHSFYNPALHALGQPADPPTSFRAFCTRVLRDDGAGPDPIQAAERGYRLAAAVCRGAALILDGCEVVHDPADGPGEWGPAGDRPEDPVLAALLGRLAGTPPADIHGWCLLTHRRGIPAVPAGNQLAVPGLSGPEIKEYLRTPDLGLGLSPGDLDGLTGFLTRDSRAITSRSAAEAVALGSVGAEWLIGGRPAAGWLAARYRFLRADGESPLDLLIAALDAAATRRNLRAWWLVRVLGLFGYAPTPDQVHAAWEVVAKHPGLPAALPDLASADIAFVTRTWLVKLPEPGRDRYDAHQTVRTFYARWWQGLHPAVWAAVQAEMVGRIRPDPERDGWKEEAFEKMWHATAAGIGSVYTYFRDDYFLNWQWATRQRLVYDKNLVAEDTELLTHFLATFETVRPGQAAAGVEGTEVRQYEAAAALTSFYAARNEWHLRQLNRADLAFGWAAARLAALGWFRSEAHAWRHRAEVNAARGRLAEAVAYARRACALVAVTADPGMTADHPEEVCAGMRVLQETDDIGMFCDITLARVYHLSGGRHDGGRADALFDRHRLRPHGHDAGMWSLIWYWWRMEHRIDRLRADYSAAGLDALLAEAAAVAPPPEGVPGPAASKLDRGVHALALATLAVVRAENTFDRGGRRAAVEEADGHARRARAELAAANQLPHTVYGHLIAAAVRRLRADDPWVELEAARQVAKADRRFPSVAAFREREDPLDAGCMWPALVDAYAEEARAAAARFRLAEAEAALAEVAEVVAMTGYHRRDADVRWARAEVATAAALRAVLQPLRDALRDADKGSRDALRELVYAAARRGLEPAGNAAADRIDPSHPLTGPLDDLTRAVRAEVLARTPEVGRAVTAQAVVFGIVAAAAEAAAVDEPADRPAGALSTARTLTIGDAAKRLGLAKSTVNQHARHGKIGRLVGRTYVFSEQELAAFSTNKAGRGRPKMQ